MNDILHDKLKKFLESNHSNSKLDISYLKQLPILLYGSGYLGKRALSGLKKLGLRPLAFIDDDKKVYGNKIDGLKILSLDDVTSNYHKDIIIIVTIWHPTHSYLDTKKKLETIKIKNIYHYMDLVSAFPDTLRYYSMFDSPQKILSNNTKVKKAFSLLDDNESKDLFIKYLKWRLTCDFSIQPQKIEKNQYLLDNLFKFNNNDIIIDCGAYNGDTLSSFLAKNKENFKLFIAIEPDRLNYAKLKKLVSQLDKKNRIKIINAAVSNKNEKIQFKSTGNMSSAINEKRNDEINSITLDKLCNKIIPTYIKMDIEGAEKDALKGAKKIIYNGKTIFAVSIYHRQSDIYEIPLFINRYNSNYNFYLRSHGKDFVDSVLYAVPKSRIRG